MEKLSYSLDEENYYDYDYICDMIENEEGYEYVYVGDNIEQHHSYFIDANILIENMQERAYEVGEWAEGYLDNIPKEKIEGLEKAISEYMDNHIEKPSFYLIENARMISIEEFKKILGLKGK